MYDFDSALFIYKFIFMTELIIAETITSLLLKRRAHFALRAFLCILGLYVLAFAIPIVSADALWVSTMFTIMFLFSLVAIFLCFKGNWITILFCGVMAYTSQHVSYIAGNYVSMLCGISSNSFYETTQLTLNFSSILVDLGFYFTIYVALFILVYMFDRKVKEIRVGSLTLIIVSAIMLTSNIVLNAMVVYEQVSRYSKSLYGLFFMYDIISCIATIMLLILSVRNKSLEIENTTMRKLWDIDKENYRIKREKIETISILCHDIKHRLQRQDGEYSESKLTELEELISKYDAVYCTGNEVVDIVLAEESAYCINNNIQFVCFVDGRVLNFMSNEHVYSLFDNFLHNAIEAVEGLSDGHKRYIKLNVAQKNEMVVINVENYFDNSNAIEFVDGIPQTTKNGEDLHGYGFKSIATIVEIYKGTMSVNVNDDMFFLDLFFPIPK